MPHFTVTDVFLLHRADCVSAHGGSASMRPYDILGCGKGQLHGQLVMVTESGAGGRVGNVGYWDLILYSFSRYLKVKP